jgi:hypothetical protein
MNMEAVARRLLLLRRGGHLGPNRWPKMLRPRHDMLSTVILVFLAVGFFLFVAKDE